jgi:diguanylate cyclase (GGDEF)-like protein/PAS domain S-box-containing protein
VSHNGGMSELGTGVRLAAPARSREIWDSGDAGITQLVDLASDLLDATIDCVWPQGPRGISDDGEESAVARRLGAAHPGLVTYLAMPIRDAESRVLGFLCAISGAARDWSDRDHRTLAHFAGSLADQIELRFARVVPETAASDHLALERRNSFLAAIVEQSEDAIVAKDSHGIIIEWNRGAETLYGYPAAEALGAPVSIIVPPERVGEDQVLLSRALTGEPQRQYETTRVRRDGTRVEVSLSVSPLFESDGHVAGASIITRDITDRVAEERARQHAEEQLRVTIDHAPIGVGLVDLSEGRRGFLLSANSAMAALLGGGSEGDDRALLGAVHPDDLDELHVALTALAANRIARRELELRLVYPNGDITWALIALAPVPPPAGTAADHEHAVVHAMDIGERKRFEGQLRHLADHDALTGLYNRRRFEEELDRSVAHTERYGFPGALLLIDLDGFKYVNDTLGHSYGDELVTRIGALLRKSVRETDVVARIGGDEFAVIASHADDELGSQMARKILASLRESAFILADRQQARVTGSIGLTTFDQSTQLTAEELVIEADIAMYQAKDAGKDQLMVYRRSGSARSQILARESWLTRIRTAIDTDGFELLAQPIVAIRAPDIPHSELLLRMRGDDGTLIRPNSFLYNAERFDLIQQIDRWVFRRAAALLAANHRGGHDVAVSVNMSGKTLGDANILEDLAAILAQYEVPSNRLIVEVTETAAITNIDRARAVARGLRELGCRFALDDFGAGFASFYYLKHLEFDYLKIDGEFVRSLTRNPTDELVIKSVVDIARGLGARTIAEAVADDESLDRLKELGVDFGQGYHLGRPMPLAQAFALLP